MPGAVEVRLAHEEDLAGIASVAAATGQDAEGLGGDPAYVRHVMATGRFAVAMSVGRCVGFGGVVQIGGATMLTDLFVEPQAQARGVGSRLLDLLWADTSSRLTFASQRPPAVALYARRGLVARWPLLYLRGDVSDLLDPGLVTEPLDPGEAAQAECDWSGVDRAPAYRYWASRPDGCALVVRDGSEVVAAGAVGGAGEEFGLNHLAASSAEVSEAATRSALRFAGAGGPRALVCLPGPHPALSRLLAAGFQIIDHDLHMSTDDVVLDPRTLVAHPGLV